MLSFVLGAALLLAAPLFAFADCGDITADNDVTATDALFLLRSAIGLSPVCNTNCECDLDCSRSISAVDAMVVLRMAVAGEVHGCCVADYCFNDEDCEPGNHCGSRPQWSCDAVCVPD